MVKELLSCADKPGSTPGDAVSCFLVPFLLIFFQFSLCLLTLFFLLACFPLFLLLTLLIMHFDQYISPEFYFKKGISRVLDLHTGQG